MPRSSSAPIVVFACRWCALLGAERAGLAHLSLPPQIRLMPVSCIGAVSSSQVLTAFANGSAGVAVLGCHLGGCRHNDANVDAKARFALLTDSLETVGIDPRRLLISFGTAHEAGQYAKLINAFADQLSQLEPMPNLARLPSEQEVAAREFTLDKDVDASLGQKRALDLRGKAGEALARGFVVLGQAKVGCSVIFDLFTTKAELDNLVAAPAHPIAKLAGEILHDRRVSSSTSLLDQALRAKALTVKDKPLAVVARACDARALTMQADLNRFARSDFELIPLACTEEEIAGCSCTNPLFPGPEKVAIAIPEKDAPLSAEKMRARRSFWEKHFSHCVLCHSCSRACPVCICPSCSLESEAALPNGENLNPLFYHLSRALHVADGCVLCGACEKACPQELPLLELHRSLAQSLAGLGYRSGESRPSPLRNLRKTSRPAEWCDSLKEREGV